MPGYSLLMTYKHSVRSLAAAIVVVGLLAVAAATMPGSAAAVGPARTLARAPATTGAALQQALNRLVAMPYGLPGVIVIVQRRGRSTVYQAGTASLARRRPLSTSDDARLTSSVRTYTGEVALSLVSRGKLRLSDTIGRVLPALPRAWHRVTLRELLQHRSGLPDYTASKELQRRLTRSARVAIPPGRLLRYVWNKPLQFRPGSRYQYDNSDNAVAAMMAEAVTGRSYSMLLRTPVYRPAGLGQTGLPSGFRLPRPYLHGYQPQSSQRREDVSEALTAWGSGGMVSSPAEMGAFIRDQLAPLFFTRQAQAAQLSFVTDSSDPPGPGTNAADLAVFEYRTSCGTVYEHTGTFPRYTQFGAATLGGGSSVTLTAREQRSHTVRPEVLAALRHAELLAVCAATAPR
jgi:D-alanyl-D-alanine carboxypeptidase